MDCDKGWNDPPAMEYDPTVSRNRGAKLFNKRVAFPINQGPAISSGLSSSQQGSTLPDLVPPSTFPMASGSVSCNAVPPGSFPGPPPDVTCSTAATTVQTLTTDQIIGILKTAVPPDLSEEWSKEMESKLHSLYLNLSESRFSDQSVFSLSELASAIHQQNNIVKAQMILNNVISGENPELNEWCPALKLLVQDR